MDEILPFGYNTLNIKREKELPNQSKGVKKKLKIGRLQESRMISLGLVGCGLRLKKTMSLKDGSAILRWN